MTVIQTEAARVMQANKVALQKVLAGIDHAMLAVHRDGSIEVRSSIKTETAIKEIQAILETDGYVCERTHFQMQYVDGPRDSWVLNVRQETK